MMACLWRWWVMMSVCDFPNFIIGSKLSKVFQINIFDHSILHLYEFPTFLFKKFFTFYGLSSVHCIWVQFVVHRKKNWFQKNLESIELSNFLNVNLEITAYIVRFTIQKLNESHYRTEFSESIILIQFHVALDLLLLLFFARSFVGEKLPAIKSMRRKVESSTISTVRFDDKVYTNYFQRQRRRRRHHN